MRGIRSAAMTGSGPSRGKLPGGVALDGVALDGVALDGVALWIARDGAACRSVVCRSGQRDFARLFPAKWFPAKALAVGRSRAIRSGSIPARRRRSAGPVGECTTYGRARVG